MLCCRCMMVTTGWCFMFRLMCMLYTLKANDGNKSKTREIRETPYSSARDAILQSDFRLSISDHVSNILGSCSSSTFALSSPARCYSGHHSCKNAVCIPSLVGSPEWIRHEPPGKFSPSGEKGWIPAPTFKTMAVRADSVLFGAIISNQHHVLRSLCKERPTIIYNLRPRPHPFELLVSDSRNFLPRLMYQDIYYNTIQ